VICGVPAEKIAALQINPETDQLSPHFLISSGGARFKVFDSKLQ